MTVPAFLRAKSEECAALAKRSHEPEIILALVKMAKELADRAAEMERLKKS
jgi:hypothetical protein